MFKNVYDLLGYLGEQCDVFAPIEKEMIRFNHDNKDVFKQIDQLTKIILMGGLK